jgi:hypothetical protein
MFPVNYWVRWLSPIKLHFNHIRKYLEMGPANGLRPSKAQAGPKEVP